MPTKQLLTGHAGALVNSAARYNVAFYGNTDTTWSSSDISPAQTSSLAAAGVMSNFRVYLSAAPGAGKSYTFTLYKNGSATDIVVTISDSDTSGQDTAHTSNVAPGDYFSIRCDPSETPATPTASWYAEFVPAIDGEFVFGSHGGGTATNNYFVRINSTPSATEGYCKMVMPCAGTVKKLFMRMSGAPGAGKSATVTARKNGTNQSLAVTVSGASDVSGTDAENSFAVAAGDILTFQISLSASMFHRISIAFVFVPANSAHVPFIMQRGSVFSTSGQNNIDGRDYAAASTIPSFDLTAVGIFVALHTAPGADKTRTILLRKNAGDTELSVTISGTDTTGSDTGSVTIDAGDLLDIAHSLTNSAANSYGSVGVLCAASTAAAPYDDGTPAGGIVFGGEVVEVATLNASEGTSSGGIVLGGPSTATTEPAEVHQVDEDCSGGIVFGGSVPETWLAEPNNWVAVKPGTYRIAGVIYTLAETMTYEGLGAIGALVNCGEPPAAAGQYRYDVLSIDTAGVITVTAGAESTAPVMPAPPSNEVRLNHVLRYAGQVTIIQADIGKLWTAPAFTVLNIAVTDDELAWAEASTAITVTCRDQYGQLFTGAKSVNAAILTGNGTIAPLVRSGAASSFSFTYTREQEVTDVSPLIEFRSPSGPFATTYIQLLDSDGELMT